MTSARTTFGSLPEDDGPFRSENHEKVDETRIIHVSDEFYYQKMHWRIGFHVQGSLY